jgi:hypothetical protein
MPTILHIDFHLIGHPAHVKLLYDIWVTQSREYRTLSFGQYLRDACALKSNTLACDNLGS